MARRGKIIAREEVNSESRALLRVSRFHSTVARYDSYLNLAVLFAAGRGQGNPAESRPAARANDDNFIATLRAERICVAPRLDS